MRRGLSEQFGKEIGLGREVEVDRAGRDPGRRRHGGHLGRAEAVIRDNVKSRLQDALPDLGLAIPTFHGFRHGFMNPDSFC